MIEKIFQGFCLKYFFEVGSGVCLWAGNEDTKQCLGYAIETEKMNLSENTKKWLLYLIAWFDTSIDWSCPTEIARHWTEEEYARFLNAANKGLQMIQIDLPEFRTVWNENLVGLENE